MSQGQLDLAAAEREVAAERGWRPILLLDFDGVLHSYSSGWKGIDQIPDPPVPGFAQFIELAIEHFMIAIFSSRSAEPAGRRAMMSWLSNQLAEHYRQNGVEFPQHRARQLLDRLTFPTAKPAAFVTLDDRALTFTGVWPDIEVLRQFRPWWQGV